ncbi:MAG: hypothetical protein ACLSWY_05000 [Ruthenibacterium lactatiformans]
MWRTRPWSTGLCKRSWGGSLTRAGYPRRWACRRRRTLALEVWWSRFPCEPVYGDGGDTIMMDQVGETG